MADFDMSSGDVRSPAGHAAFSMKGTDDRWVQIQLNTFTNWVNEQLRDTDFQVEQLIGDLSDGIRLCLLMEVLQGRKIGRVVKKPFNQHHYLENVNIALRAMTNDNIKLVNIGSEDIVNGNAKLTMALIWHLILRYQIGKSKVPPKKLMLSWIRAVLPDLGITNFSTDWNDGIALQALINYCRPGTCPNWRQLMRKDGLNNCKEAMELAKQHFGIPLVLSPEDLSSPDLDELSGMTYLSYFMKLDSPGYNTTLRWVQKQVPNGNVRNFQDDWTDGTALTALVRKLGGDVPNHPNPNDHEGVITAAMSGAEGLGVEPVISAKEMADPEVDHLGVMAYAAWFQHANNLNDTKPKVSEARLVMAAPPVPVTPPPPPEPPKPVTPPEDMLSVLWRRQDVYTHKPVSLTLEAQDEDFDPEKVHLEVIGPRGSRPQSTVSWSGSVGHGVFTPQEVGAHRVVVNYADAVVKGCPLNMDAKVDVSSVRLASPVAASYTGKPTPIKISAKDARRGAVKVEARAPSGRVHEMSVVDNNGVYTANFTPTEVGEWQVAIKYEGQHIQGSPFNVRVYDAAQVKVYGLQGGAVGKTFTFSVDTTGAGEGELTVNIVHNGRIVPANITHDPGMPGRFTVNFTPDGSGIYNIKVFFSGIQVTGSPYTLEIVDSSQVTASGKGLSTVEINRTAEFIVNTGHPTSSGDLKVDVTGPRANKIPSTVRNIDAATFAVEYVPSDVGEYIIDVSFYGRPIKGSPFKAQAFDWSRIKVSHLRETGMVGRPVEFDIDAGEAGSGNLEIMVNDGTIPCSVQNRGNRQFHASFVPKEAKSHFVQMRFNAREVPVVMSEVTTRRRHQKVTYQRSSDTTLVSKMLSLSSDQEEIVSDMERALRREASELSQSERDTAKKDKKAIEGFKANIATQTEQLKESVKTRTIPSMHRKLDRLVELFVEQLVKECLDKPQADESPQLEGDDASHQTIEQKTPDQQVTGHKNNGTKSGDKSVLVTGNHGNKPETEETKLKDVLNSSHHGNSSVTMETTDPEPVKLQSIKNRMRAFEQLATVEEHNKKTVGKSSSHSRPLSHSVVTNGRIGNRGDGVDRVGVNGSTTPVGPAANGMSDTADSSTRSTSRTSSTSSVFSGSSQVAPPGDTNNRTDPKKADAVLGPENMTGKMRSDSTSSTGSSKATAMFSVSWETKSRPSVGKVKVRSDIDFGQQQVKNHSSAGKSREQSKPEPKKAVTVQPKTETRQPESESEQSTDTAPQQHPDPSRNDVDKDPAASVRGPEADTAPASQPWREPESDTEPKPFRRLRMPSRLSLMWPPRDTAARDNGDAERTSEPPKPAEKNDEQTEPARSHSRSNSSGSKVSTDDQMRPADDGVPELAPPGGAPGKSGFGGFKMQATQQTAEQPAEEMEADTLEQTTPSLDTAERVLEEEKAPGNILREKSHDQAPVVVRRSLISWPPPRNSADLEGEEEGTSTGPGSPWRVDILSAANVTATGNGLQLVPVNNPTRFEIRTGNVGYSGEIAVQIISPSGRQVPSAVTNVGGGTYSVEYLPNEVGNYQVNVNYEQEPIPNSPFTSKAYDASAIQVSSIPNGMVSKPVEFTIDVTQAGEGQLEIMVNRGSVPNSVRMMRKGVFLVSFVPRDPRPHSVDIKFNGQLLPFSPINVPILDSSRVTVQGEGLRQVAVNRQSFFRVNTQSAGDADLAVRVTSPRGRQVPVTVLGSGSSGFDVDFKPSDVGTYKVDMDYGGQPIPGSPFQMKVYDPTKVKAREVKDGIVGVKSGFLVDIEDSGEGSLEISIIGPSGNNIHNQVHQLGPGHFEVVYTPAENGHHQANVMFNKEHVPGSPMTFNVIDASMVTATGDGLGLVACNRPTGFSIYAPGARTQDLNIQIIGPDGRNILSHVFESKDAAHRYNVEYTPVSPGDHRININYFGQTIPGSPFTAKAWDATKVIVSNLTQGRIGKPTHFTIDASHAGSGSLEIVVSSGGDNVPNFVKAAGNGRFDVSFTPQTIDTHSINIRFNGDMVPGCPFLWEPDHPSRLQSLGDGILRVPVARPAVVVVDPRRAGALAEAAVVEVTAPSDRVLRAHVARVQGKNHLRAEFVPREVGPHCIQVTVGNLEVQGSPFACEVYDITKVKVNGENKGIVGKLHEMEIDARKAGAGDVEAIVRLDAKGRLPCKVVDVAPGLHKVAFLPRSAQHHTVIILFSREPVPGSPYLVDVEDTTQVIAHGRALECTHIGQKASFGVDPAQALYKADVNITITGPSPNKEDIPCFIQGSFVDSWTIEWRPLKLGVYTIDVRYGDTHVVGSPFKCKVYDLRKVHILRERQTRGSEEILGDVVFYVDASDAGAGNLEVVVRNRRDGTRIPNFLEAEEKTGKFRVYFTPRPSCYSYEVDVTFNDEPVFGSPFYHAIIDGSKATASGPGLQRAATNRPTYFDVFTQGVSGEAPLHVDIKGPRGQPVGSRLSGSSKAGFRVEYAPLEPGQHIIQVIYADVDIQGSPFLVDMYDATKVKVGNIPEGVLGQPVKFEVDTSSAGSGMLSVEVKGQSSTPHCDITTRSSGRQEVIFVPREMAPHYVYITFNGDSVPGSPFTAQVFDWTKLSMNWEAAQLASVHKAITLTLDPQGAPEADVDATITDPYGREVPNQISRHGVKHHVTFTPLVVGPHTMSVKYGGQEITGSPATCNVYDASKVKVTDVTQPGVIKQEMGFTVDTAEAGTGELAVEMFTQTGQVVHAHRQQLDQFRHRYTFTPLVAKDHNADITFNSERIPGAPLMMSVFDWNNIRVNWERARLVPVNKVVCVDLDPQGAPEATVIAKIIDPIGREVANSVTRNGHMIQIMFTPLVIGPHVMTLTYGGQLVQGSPFTLNAYDTARVKVHDVSYHGPVRQDMGLTVDTSEAGDGVVEVEVKCEGRLLLTKEGVVEQNPRRHRRYTFVPAVAEGHHVEVYFNKETVAGSPFAMTVFDPNTLKVTWDPVRPVPLHRLTTLTLDPCGAPNAAVTATVQDPENWEIQSNVTKDASVYRATFTPVTLGPHKVTFTYADHVVPGNPFVVLTFDPSLVKVTDVSSQVIMGQEAHFTVDVANSGYRGDIAVEVKCRGQTVPIRYFPLDQYRRKFSFTPLVATDHEIHVSLEDIKVEGVPYTVRVIDFGDLVVDYEGARSLPIGGLPIVYLDPRGLPDATLEAKVSDQQGRDIPVFVHKEEGKFRVEFNPQEIGVYTVTLTFCGQSVPGSPHQCIIYDPQKVKVIDLKENGHIGEEIGFGVDVTDVGEGELRVQVLALGQSIPLSHQPISKYRHQFTFVPQANADHQVHIVFNKERLPNSPYVVSVFDVKEVTTNWDAMRPVPVNRLVAMEMDPRGLPESHVDVSIIDPVGQQVQPRVYFSAPVHRIEYTPTSVGVYTVHIRYGGQAIPGSPFLCNAYDTSRIAIQEVMSSVLVGVETGFKVDLSKAGPGLLGAEITHNGTNVVFQHQRLEHMTHRFSFVPMATGDHSIKLNFNGETVTGTPFNINAYNLNKMTVNAEAARLVPVNQPITVELDPRGVPDAKVDVRVSDRHGQSVPTQVVKKGTLFLIEFVPRVVGLYNIDLRCGGHPVPGSPYQCNAYDPTKVKLIDVTATGLVREEMGFTVETAESGQGELAARVQSASSHVQLTQRRLDQHRVRFTFIPVAPGDHVANVAFNKIPVPNTPFTMSVMDPSVKMFVRTDPNMQKIAAGTTGASYLQTQGAGRVNVNDITMKFLAPNGELVPAKILQQPDGDYKVEYSSRYTGRHTVEILYAGQAIMGSPFYVEIYDPNKVRVEGTRSGIVGQKMEFEIISNEAGRAELGLSIISSSGRKVPFDINPGPNGDKVTYLPTEPGPHQIYITYGGLEIPGEQTLWLSH